MSVRPIHVPNGPIAYLKSGVIRYHDRNIVMVVTPDKRQPFYQSTGRNSHLPEEWLPFDGVLNPGGWEWFDKGRYCLEDGNPLDRYGTEYYYEISQALKSMTIPDGQEVESGMDVNLFLGVLEKYATNDQRQAWTRNKNRGLYRLRI